MGSQYTGAGNRFLGFLRLFPPPADSPSPYFLSNDFLWALKTDTPLHPMILKITIVYGQRGNLGPQVSLFDSSVSPPFFCEPVTFFPPCGWTGISVWISPFAFAPNAWVSHSPQKIDFLCFAEVSSSHARSALLLHLFSSDTFRAMDFELEVGERLLLEFRADATFFMAWARERSTLELFLSPPFECLETWRFPFPLQIGVLLTLQKGPCGVFFRAAYSFPLKAGSVPDRPFFDLFQVVL